jgi:hypothetical protein
MSKKCSIFAVDLIKVILTTKTQKTMAKQTKKQNIVVLFNNYDCNFDEYKKDYIENNEIEGDVSDQTIWEFIADIEHMDWDNMMCEIKHCFELKQINIDYQSCVVIGTAGTWRGKCEAGKVYKTIEDAIYGVAENCDYIKVWCENGHLYIMASHHDGTHNFEIKLLTNKGKETYDNWNSGFYCGESLYHKSDWEVIEMLSKYNLYSKLPRVEKYF